MKVKCMSDLDETESISSNSELCYRFEKAAYI